MGAYNTTLALLFPGQGCQFVGMGADLCQAHSAARAVFARADEVLAMPLSALCFEGPEDALDDTANTQPAIYTATYALWRVLASRLGDDIPRVAYVAGHSLGEFSALAVSGALTFEDGLRLVRARGVAMRDSGTLAPGGMAAILGLDDDAVARIVADASDGSRVWVANLNSPGQVVIAGEHEALRRALALAVERGAKRAVELPVSVACHTPLMGPAAERLAAALETTPIARPLAPVVSNATARPTSDPAEIRANLLRQLTGPVRWVESVRAMVSGGVDAMLEVGPKAVVSGLVRRIDRSLTLHSATDAAGVEALARTLATAEPEAAGA